jgi:hypothetical protein
VSYRYHTAATVVQTPKAAATSIQWHKAAEADELLSKAYLALQSLKFSFDNAMEDIPEQYLNYYRALMKASDEVTYARREVHQVRMLTQKVMKLM